MGIFKNKDTHGDTAAVEPAGAAANALFATLCASCVVLALLSTALNTALPAMAAGLGVQTQTAQWLVSGYALALAICMPATGYLASRFASRPLYLLALAVFTLSSFACALASNFALVMVARVLQAAANALVSNLTQVTILATFPKGQRGTRMGWFGLSVGVAPVVAPALGGLVVDTLTWRALFGIIGAAGVLCLIAASAFIRNTLPTSAKHFDVASFGLSVLVFGGFTVGLGQLPTQGLASAASLAPLLCGALAAVAFVPRQLRAQEPFFNLQLLKLPRFRRSVVASAALYAAMMGGAAVLPVHLQLGLGCSAWVAGAAVLPAALLMALVNPLAGKLFDRIGMRWLAAAGGLLLLAGSALMCVPSLSGSVLVAAILAMVRYVGIGLVQMPLVTWGNACVRQEDMPQATALLTSFRNVAGALGVAVFVGMLDTVGVAVSFAGMAAASLLVFAAALKE